MASSEVIRIGSAIKHRGEYNNSKTYYFGNQVTMYGSVFQAISNDFSGVPPLVKNENGDVELANTSTWNCIIDNIELYNVMIINDFSGFAKKGEAVKDVTYIPNTKNVEYLTFYVNDAAITRSIDAATKSSAGVMSAADKIKLDGIAKCIDLTNIDSIPASIDDAKAIALDPEHSRWALTYTTSSGSKINVGVIDIFSDSDGHQLTEVLTTNYRMVQGILDWTAHEDTKVYTYYRKYNISSSSLSSEAKRGTWSTWSEYIPETITNAIRSEANKREEADTVLTENLQKVIDSDVYLTQDEYEALAEKDPTKTYYIYEEE